jgi:type II secretory pathway pseudopilin PulG
VANGSRHCKTPAAAGFTYIGLLIAVAVLGLALSAVGTVWRTTAQREREKELLFIGHEFQAAIAAYYESGGRQFPQDLGDLMEDKRWPEPRHFLRRLYADPMTGQTDWTVIREESLGITGIASSSAAAPIKRSGFQPEEESFADAETYQDWKFVFTPHMGRRRITANPVMGN